ncbi:DHHW family protein [Xylanibacter muris]|nr:DHHW family protein [Xylanibacter muris]
MNKLYIFIIGLVFAAFVTVFDTLPRSTYSHLEKRDLAVFPDFTVERLISGAFTKEVSSWFSDSEPFRDELMAVSLHLKDFMRLSASEDQITFHAAEKTDAVVTEDDEDTGAVSDSGGDGLVDGYVNDTPDDGSAKIANAGIVIVGRGDKVRALMAYGGGPRGGGAYADVANKYKETFGSKVNVYCMVIPTAIEYYCPEQARKATNRQWPTINNVHSRLNGNVKAVDVYTSLGKHADEDIYLRTDHHWSPLGAFYAAKEFARVAGVPFRELDSYTRKVVHGYVGSMYGYSKDISIKNAPEDFVYYVPSGVTFNTTYIDYRIDKSYHVTGMGKPYKGPFFYKFKDGSGGAYCTFMGSDAKITKVVTSTNNGRRVLILKDSFGNAIPGYLFFSFEEVHVVDTRYFTKNMKEYVVGNGITDILFANNIFNAYNPRFCSRYARFLTQADGSGIHTPSPVAADSAGLHPGNVRHADAQEHHVPSADSAFSNRQKENTQPKAEADSTGNDI